MARIELDEAAAPTHPGTAGLALIYPNSDNDGNWEAKDSDSQVHRLSDSGMRDNLVINGSFFFAQRQAPASLTTYSNTTGRAYGPDRWGMTNETASIQFQRVDVVATPVTNVEADCYGIFKKITNAGKIFVSQVIESRSCVHLRGKTVRLQMKMKYSVGGSPPVVRIGLMQIKAAGTVDLMPATFVTMSTADGTDPTAGTNLGYITPVTAKGGSISGSGVSCTLTTTFATYGATFSLPTDFKNLIVCIWSNADFAANDDVWITEVGLYDGPELRQWNPRHFADEFDLCQRYYFKTFFMDTLPAQAVGIGNGEVSGMIGIAAATAQFIMVIFPVKMRINVGGPAPTSTTFNPAAASAEVRNITGAVNHTGTAVANIYDWGCRVDSTGNAAGTVGQRMAVHVVIDAEL